MVESELKKYARKRKWLRKELPKSNPKPSLQVICQPLSGFPSKLFVQQTIARGALTCFVPLYGWLHFEHYKHKFNWDLVKFMSTLRMIS